MGLLEQSLEALRNDIAMRPAVADDLATAFNGTVEGRSLRTGENALAGILEQGGKERFFALTTSDAADPFSELAGERESVVGCVRILADVGPDNLPGLLRVFPALQPVPLGLAASFGFGDRIGLATPGHVRAMQDKGAGITPIFAQQSIREMQRTQRTPEQVMSDAVWGAFGAGWTGRVGADADHLKTFEDVRNMADAGFVFFTIDPSDHVDQHADDYDAAIVEERFAQLLEDKVEGVKGILPLYQDKSYDLGGEEVVLTEEVLKRAAVKYGRALEHIYAMSLCVAQEMNGDAFELEISVDETEQPTSVPEHLFLALELRRHEIPVISLAPRFVGDFEKGVDFKGDLRLFEDTLKQHARIAKEYGPYKISLHSGSDKFGVYPYIARETGQCFHVKTAGTSYLEALRTCCRVDRALFTEIVEFSRGRFDTDRATYHIAATLDGTPQPQGQSAEALETLYLDENNGRQILHVTFGSVLTDTRFRAPLYELLRANGRIHEDVLAAHLGKHLQLLSAADS